VHYIDYLNKLAKEDDCRWVNLKSMKYQRVYEIIDSTKINDSDLVYTTKG